VATGIAVEAGGGAVVAGGAWAIVSPTKGEPSGASIESSGQTRMDLVRRSLPVFSDRALGLNILRFGSIARPPSAPGPHR